MKLFKKTAIAAVLSALSMAASAMTPIADEGLSQVAGQDGVSIAANLNINMSSFVYTDTDTTTGGSIHFQNVKFNGLLAAEIDVINGATFAAIRAGLPGTDDDIGGSFFSTTSDVVQIAVPPASSATGGRTITVPTEKILSVSVDAIRMGNGAGGTETASFGKFAMNNIDMRGTTAWIWAH